MIHIAFLGDISLNDTYTNLAKAGKKPFYEIENYLSDKDLVIGNLEAFAEGTGENTLKKPRLKTSIEALNYLKQLNIGLVTLANNHISDNLEEGFDNTIRYLSNAGIDYIGASTSSEGVHYPYLCTIKNKRFAFFNYVTADTHPAIPPENEIYVNFYNRSSILHDISTYRPICDYLILLLHWGGRLEGAIYPDFYQITDSHAFIDAGADLIIGHHSHVFQPYEKYNGRYIYYSLGNFCFSDISFEGYKINMQKKCGYSDSAIVDVTFDINNFTSHIVPIKNKTHYIIPAKSLPLTFIFASFFFPVIKKIKPIWKIYFFYRNTCLMFLYRLKLTVKSIRRKNQQ